MIMHIQYNLYNVKKLETVNGLLPLFLILKEILTFVLQNISNPQPFFKYFLFFFLFYIDLKTVNEIE